MDSMDNFRERFKALEQRTEPLQQHTHTFARRLTITVAGLVLMLWVGISWGGPPNNDVSDAGGNTAGGTNALVTNTTGSANTAFGENALLFNTTGSNNTASGFDVLLLNTTGSNNTASGAYALLLNTTGSNNTASGFQALFSNTTGDFNLASGAYALLRNTTGGFNLASGFQALFSNTTGGDNTAVGGAALEFNTTGSNNTAIGFDALLFNTTGSNNIAIGSTAGLSLTTGDNNIYLGNSGTATESNTMHLGQGQTRTFIAGIAGVPVTGSAVLVSSTGQLGIQASSIRYKRDIQPMGAHSRGLFQLRPVIFRYKQDVQGERQYGLIAEDVAKVYPELVTRGANGEVESVRYQEVIPMLLNEVQHQQRQLTELQAQNARLRAAVQQQQAQNAALAARLERLEEAAARAGALASR